MPMSEPWDYLHLNSIDVLPDGNLLVRVRHTFALYKLDRKTGKVIWRLGGKRSDFDMGPGTQFAWQHDGRQVGRRRSPCSTMGPYVRLERAAALPRAHAGRGLHAQDGPGRRISTSIQQPLVSVACGNVQRSLTGM